MAEFCHKLFYLFPPRRILVSLMRMFSLGIDMLFCKRIAFIIGLISYAISPMFAQATDELEEVVVVANRVPMPIQKIGTSVTIIDEAKLKAHGNFSLINVLRQTPAVGVTSNGGIGSASSLRIRGEEGFRTLTIIDGLKISDPSAPQVLTPHEHILNSGLSRIEILRGPQGLSYGADAGGVIAISSRPAEEGFAANIESQVGSRGTQQESLNLSSKNDFFEFSLIGTQFDTDGYNVRASDNVLRDSDGYKNDSVHAQFGTNIKDKVRIQLVHRNVAGNSQYDGCFAIKTVYDCKSRYQLDATRISLEYSNNSFTHSLAYSKSATDRDDFALGNRAFGSNGEIKRIEYISSARNLVGFDLVFGIDLEQEINGSLDRENKAIYFEYISDFSDSFFLTAGLRRDENADFGNHNSSRLTGAYLIKRGNSNIKLKASYGSGFRAPSLFEVSYNVGPFSFPPASIAQLSEEISTGFEYGIEYLSQNMQLELVRFNQEVENAIYFDLSGFSGYLQDTGNSISKGIEISGSIIASETISLNANYTFNATERPNGLQRIRRPEKLANLGISFVSSSERLRINAFYRISKESVDELFGSPINLDDFEVLDISAAYRLSANVELFARLENTLDEEYREILDFNAPDRASYIGIRLSF